MYSTEKIKSRATEFPEVSIVITSSVDTLVFASGVTLFVDCDAVTVATTLAPTFKLILTEPLVALI